MNNQKSYKIVVSSKKMRNICGASPVEVAKKVALKLLVKNIYNMYFSIIEIKTNKIIHYQSNKIELVRPYHKNGKLVKYRIVVKKMGKQVGGEYKLNLEDPNDPIYIFFPKDRYNTSFYQGKKTYNGTYYNKIIFIKDLDNNNCLEIAFGIIPINKTESLYIELSQLDKCNFKGGPNLQNLINYAGYLKYNFINNLKYILLDDASCIKDNGVYLSVLSILTTGQSWYNRFGFISEDHDSDIEHNSRTIKMKIKDFIKLIIDKLKNNNENNEKNENNENNENNEKLIKKINSFFEKYDESKTVQDVFIEIKRELLENKINKTNINIIKKILKIASLSKLIQYYNCSLKYTIPETNS